MSRSEKTTRRARGCERPAAPADFARYNWRGMLKDVENMHLRKFFAIFAALLVVTLAGLAHTLPPGVEKVTSIEGVTEYAFPNGLHVLLFPDNSKPKITVNVVYLVGSRNEAYGETGMAHLLEHMTFKSAKSGRELFKELTDRAAGNFNGQTSYDQTMYFETFNASDDNLRWALGL